MAKRNIQKLGEFIKKLKMSRIKAHNLALLEIMQIAEKDAIKNVRREFTGRVPGRRLTGRLMNGIFVQHGREPGTSYTVAAIGVRGVPYARIHEYGSQGAFGEPGLPDGVIKPKKAKNLWLKNFEVPSQFKRMTPRQYVEMMKKQPREYQILESTRGQGRVAWFFGTAGRVRLRKGETFPEARSRVAKWIPLFYLRKQVTIPDRPYLHPAVVYAITFYQKALNKHMKSP